MAGRPSSYSEKIADRICEELAEGRSLRAICKQEAWAPGSTMTVFRWLQEHPEFEAKYARARELQAELRVEEIIAISDNDVADLRVDEEGRTQVDYGVIARDKLRIESRRWYAEKLRPKVYGNRLAVEHSGSIDFNFKDVSTDDLLAELAEMLSSGVLKPPGVEALPDVRVIDAPQAQAHPDDNSDLI